MLSSLGAGLLFPQFGAMPDWFITLAIAITIFCASSKVAVQDFNLANLRQGTVFYVIRFLLLPVMIYFAFMAFWPDLGQVILLFTLAPAGVTIPAWAGMLGGHAGLAMGLVLLSSIFAPVAIPGIFELVVGQHVAIDTVGMFVNLLIMVVLPLGLYMALFRRWPQGHAFIKDHTSFVTVILMFLVVAIVIARKNEYLMADPAMVVGYVLLLGVLQAFFYAIGWYFAFAKMPDVKITYALASGAPNIALAIALAFMFLPGEAGVIMVIGEIPWILGMVIFKRILSWRGLSPARNA